jgi:hypothetical protein
MVHADRSQIVTDYVTEPVTEPHRAVGVGSQPYALWSELVAASEQAPARLVPDHVGSSSARSVAMSPIVKAS